MRNSTAQKKHAKLFQSLAMACRDALVMVVLTSMVALMVNWLRPKGMPLIADEPYEILVPCLEPGGEVTEFSAKDPLLQSGKNFIVDARPAKEFVGQHFRHAVNIAYNYLDPTPQEQLEQLAKNIAKSGAQRVIVYGDGDLPDTGEQLGKEISGFGIKNVYFVKGGAKALFEQTDTSEPMP